jgi:predicted O-linked N-acetylglucosamine transferase (SPINDLY family)
MHSRKSALPKSYDAEAAAAHLRAYMEYAVGDFVEADRIMRDAITRTPNDPALHFNDGLIQGARGNWDDARLAFQRARDAEFHATDATYNLAVAEARCGASADAAAHRRLALRRDPRLIVAALLRPGTLVTRHGWQLPERDLPEILDAISYAHLQRGEPKLAEATCRRAIKFAPEARRYLALGAIMMRRKNFSDARAAFLKAQNVGADPRAADPYLAAVTLDLKEYAEARERYLRLASDKPDDLFPRSQLLLIDTVEGQLDWAKARFDELIRIAKRRGFGDLSWDALSSIAYRAIMWPLSQPLRRKLDAEIDRKLSDSNRHRSNQYPLERASINGRRLRVGYLSSFFRNHPIGHVTVDLFGAHNRKNIEVHVFQTSALSKDPYSKLIQSSAEHFHHLTGKITETAQAIADAELDILVYLDGYMDLRPMQVVTLRPAPIQIHWLGHAGECAISGLDFVIADDVVLPQAEESQYRSKIVRLPNSYHCASAHAIGRTKSRQSYGLPKRGFIFCCFNNPEKIDRTIFDAWIRIVKGVEESVLWLSAGPSKTFERNLKQQAEQVGIDPERLIFADRLPKKADHLARLRHCGLLLDTVTLNASTTALDALWAGVPVLTVHGDRFASRIATSMLKAIGLEEMICASLSEYEQRAIALANDPQALAGIHEKLARNIGTRPLFDIQLFCRNLEALYGSLVRPAP